MINKNDNTVNEVTLDLHIKAARSLIHDYNILASETKLGKSFFCGLNP